MVDLYARYSGVIIVMSLVLPIVGSLLHYLLVGAKGVPLKASAGLIQRFSMPERIFHFIRMLSFIIAAATCIYFILHGGSKSSGIIHSTNGGIFLLMSICTLVIWFRPGLFNSRDGLWLRRLGGYLTREEMPLPAGKFNAGQKLFFWLGILLAVILTITGVNLMTSMINQTEVNGALLVIHGISAALLIAAVMGHIYLSLWVNQGAWRILTSGRVSEEWALCHHPDWDAALPTRQEEKA